MFKNIDWSALASYAWHIALVAGGIAVNVYAPGLAPVLLPALQAAGQVSNPPSGVHLYKQQ